MNDIKSPITFGIVKSFYLDPEKAHITLESIDEAFGTLRCAIPLSAYKKIGREVVRGDESRIQVFTKGEFVKDVPLFGRVPYEKLPYEAHYIELYWFKPKMFLEGTLEYWSVKERQKG